MTRHEKTREVLQQRFGGAALRVQTALDILEQLLGQNADGIAVAELHWQSLQRFLPITHSPRFAAVTGGKPMEGNLGDSNLRSQLLEGTEAEAEKLLLETVRREIAQILRLPLDKVEPEQNLSQLGLDSLMGVELALALEEQIGIKIPTFLLSEGPTPLRLAQRLVQTLRAHDANSTPEDGLQCTREELEARHGVAKA